MGRELSELSGTDAYMLSEDFTRILLEHKAKEFRVREQAVKYGNSKHGTNTIIDADDDWILVRIDSAKGSKEKLIRVGAVKRIGLAN